MAIEHNQDTGKWDIAPLNQRCEKTVHDNESLVGRTQTVLMEALDREDFKLATKRVRNVEDLNFVNSTGDTALTKALTKRQFGLVLEMLRRESDPIGEKTVLRNSNKHGYSLIRNSIDHGQVEILRDVFGRFPLIKWSERIVLAKYDGRPDEFGTPLYYAVGLLARQRIPMDDRVRMKTDNLPTKLFNGHPKSPIGSAADGTLECIKFLVNEARVDLDSPHFYGHSALTLSAEARLHDVALMLLEAGANVNHRINTGATALVYAIANNDAQMVRLLHEYKADSSFEFNMIDQRGLPSWRGHIYEMPMSHEMRLIIRK